VKECDIFGVKTHSDPPTYFFGGDQDPRPPGSTELYIWIWFRLLSDQPIFFWIWPVGCPSCHATNSVRELKGRDFTDSHDTNFNTDSESQ